jgi:hypothetical protein
MIFRGYFEHAFSLVNLFSTKSKNSEGGLHLNTREFARNYRLSQWTQIVQECGGKNCIRSPFIAEFCGEKIMLEGV